MGGLQFCASIADYLLGGRRLSAPICRTDDLTAEVRPLPRAARESIHMHQRANRRVRTDDRFFRRLVASMRNGVVAIHRDGTLALVNEEAYRIFSVEAAHNDIGRHYADVFRQRPDLIRVLAGAYDLTMLPNRAELRLRDLGRVIGYTLSLVRDEDAATVGAVLFFKDLTQVEQLEERERLRDRLVSLGEMAAGIAHELKNPLAGIEVMAGLLRRQVPQSADAQALLADIISEVKLANGIVMEMLEFVRPVRLQLEPTSLAQVLEHAIAAAERKIPRRHTVVQLDIPADLPLVDSDATQLSHVFVNLIINAFEALGGSGALHVRAGRCPSAAVDGRDAPPSVFVDVHDTGPGIAPEVSERMFNPFFTTKATGSGLGLPIVRKIVDAHDGCIDVTSAPDQGTRFRVTLPLSSPAWWNK